MTAAAEAMTAAPVLRASGLGIRFLRGNRRAMLRAMAGELLGRRRRGASAGPARAAASSAPGAAAAATADPAGAFWALRDVDLELPEGACLGVCGSNGAGKTTLLRLVAGIYRPDAGTVQLAGRSQVLLSLGAATSHHLSGRENVFVAGAVMGLDRATLRELYPRIRAFAELDEATMSTPVRYYSAGMRTRLGFAIASVLEPDVLLLDEILSVGDPAFRAKSAARLRELMGRARCLVVSSHSISFLKAHCDHGLWLHEGRVREAGPGPAAFEAYARFAGVG